MTKNNPIFKNTDKRSWWKYEEGKEDKRRRKHLNPPKRSRLGVRGTNLRTHSYMDVPHEVYLFLKERGVMIAMLIVLLSVWWSGYLAASDQAFWSLLVLVLGMLIGAMLGGKEDGRN